MKRNMIDPEHVMLALTSLRDFMVERGIMEVSMSVYDPNRIIRYPTRGLCRNRDNDTPTHEVLYEYHLSFGRTRKSQVTYKVGLKLGTKEREAGRWILTQLA